MCGASLMKNQPSSQTVLFSTAETAVSGQPGLTKTPISSGVIGILIFMVTEAMFFAGLISAYMVIRAGIEAVSYTHLRAHET